MTLDEIDWKGLIRDSYDIEGLGPEDARAIFFDWALSVKEIGEEKSQIQMLLGHYESQFPDHPMTEVLREGLAQPVRTGRRGGRKARLPDV